MYRVGEKFKGVAESRALRVKGVAEKDALKYRPIELCVKFPLHA